MRLKFIISLLTIACAATWAQSSPPSQVWTWDQVKDRFEQGNTTLLAASSTSTNSRRRRSQHISDRIPISRLTADGTQITPSHGVWQPFAGTFVSPGVGYLFERRNKRNLRFQAAKEGTAIGVAQASDSERTLLFNLRSAFVGILQAKAVVKVSRGQSRVLRQDP